MDKLGDNLKLEKQPTAEKAAKVLEEGINKKYACIISANCTARYSGRAESFLDLGDRIIFIKPDTTVLIHQTSGSQPVNWMPNNTVHNVSVKKDKLVLSSARISPPEKLEVEMDQVHFVNIMEMEDREKIQTQGSEKHMAEMIYKNPSLISKDFKPVSMEEQTKYGFIDVFGHDGKGVLTIVECKRYSADLGAVTQLRRYVERIKKDKGLKKVNGVIAAPKISSNAKKMLEDWGFKFKMVEPPKHFEEKKKKQSILSNF